MVSILVVIICVYRWERNECNYRNTFTLLLCFVSNVWNTSTVIIIYSTPTKHYTKTEVMCKTCSSLVFSKTKITVNYTSCVCSSIAYRWLNIHVITDSELISSLYTITKLMSVFKIPCSHCWIKTIKINRCK